MTRTENSAKRQKKTGAPQVTFSDVNGDGLLDVVITFERNKTGLTSDHSLGILTELRNNGTVIDIEFSLSILSGGGGKGSGGKGGWVLFRTHAPLLLLFGLPLIAIQTDAVWDNFPLGKGGATPGPWERSVMSYILLALVGMTLAEGLLSRIRLALDPVALVITDEGVRGYHAWLRRSFKWNEVSHVVRSGNRLCIYQQAKSRLLREWNGLSRPGGRYHWSQLLVVELNCVDRTAEFIFAEIDRHWKSS